MTNIIYIYEEEEEKKKIGVTLFSPININQFYLQNNDDILNDTNDEKEYAKETFDINCPHCKKELPYHGEGVTICLETCRHILCRWKSLKKQKNKRTEKMKQFLI